MNAPPPPEKHKTPRAIKERLLTAWRRLAALKEKIPSWAWVVVSTPFVALLAIYVDPVDELFCKEEKTCAIIKSYLAALLTSDKDAELPSAVDDYLNGRLLTKPSKH